MGRKRGVAWLVGTASLTAATLVLLWPGEPANLAPAPVRHAGDELDTLVAAARRKQALKAVVIEDLVAGRLTLAAAVDRCDEIEKEFPQLADEYRKGLSRLQPGRTYREKVAYSLVAHCESRLRARPVPDDTVLARLNAELTDFVGAPAAARSESVPIPRGDGRFGLEQHRSR